MQLYKAYQHKAVVSNSVIYTMVVAFGAATGVSFAYIYNRLPAMQMRYEASLKETTQAQKFIERIQGSRSLDDFVYDNFYQPIKDIVSAWKGHVKDSLEVEHNRTLKEQLRR
jgi:hypothetical protein